MKILITGSTGFIGRHIVTSLLNNPNYELYVLARDEKKAYDLFRGKVAVYKGDLSDRETLKIPLKDKDIVIHSAALMSNYEYKGKKGYYEVNIKGMENILMSCDMPNIKRFLHISSVGIYGDTKFSPAKENRDYGLGLSTYEWSKKEAELVLFKYCKQYNISFTVLRLAQLYGPGMYYGWPDTMKSIIKGKMLIPGKGEGKVHLLNVRDCVEAIKLSINNEKAINKIYNIAGPEILLLRDVLETISTLLGVGKPKTMPYSIAYLASLILSILPWRIKPKDIRLLTPHRVKFFKNDHIYDISSAKEDLGYKPVISARDGFSEMITWCKKEGLF